jgi:hypothetical protein
MWRDEQTNKKQNKQIDKQKTVLVLLFQHTTLVLVFKQKLCHSLTRWLSSVFFFSSVFQWQQLGQLLPPVRCGSLSLYVVLKFQNQLCTSPAVLLCSWVVAVLFYWGLVSLPHPLSLEQGQ